MPVNVAGSAEGRVRLFFKHARGAEFHCDFWRLYDDADGRLREVGGFQEALPQ